MKIVKITLIIVFSLVTLLFFAVPVKAMRNPSAVYCHALGYHYTIEITELGEKGICVLPDGQAVDAWQFLEGKVAQEQSYCKKMGYEIKTVQDSKKCERIFSKECAFCVLPDGKEVEVTELMNLSFEEKLTFGEGGGQKGLKKFSNLYWIFGVFAILIIVAIFIFRFWTKRKKQ